MWTFDFFYAQGWKERQSLPLLHELWHFLLQPRELPYCIIECPLHSILVIHNYQLWHFSPIFCNLFMTKRAGGLSIVNPHTCKGSLLNHNLNTTTSANASNAALKWFLLNKRAPLKKQPTVFAFKNAVLAVSKMIQYIPAVFWIRFFASIGRKCIFVEILVRRLPVGGKQLQSCLRTQKVSEHFVASRSPMLHLLSHFYSFNDSQCDSF